MIISSSNAKIHACLQTSYGLTNEDYQTHILYENLTVMVKFTFLKEQEPTYKKVATHYTRVLIQYEITAWYQHECVVNLFMNKLSSGVFRRYVCMNCVYYEHIIYYGISMRTQVELQECVMIKLSRPIIFSYIMAP